MNYPEPTIQPSEGLQVEQGTHVILLNLVTDYSTLYALDRLRDCCADFKIQLAHILQKRVHLLRDDARFIGARKEMDKLKSSRSESKDKTARLKELRDVIRDLSKEYGVDSQSVYNETRELRKLKVYSYLLNSQIAQKICEDLMAGIKRVLSGEGMDIHIPRRYDVDTIVAKQDGNGLILDLSGGKVTVSFRGVTKTRTYPDEKHKGRPIYKSEKQKVTIEAKATRTSDAMDEIDALRVKYAKYKFSGLPNGHNPVRYCAIRRILYMENGQVRHGYQLLIVVAGNAPKRKGARPIGEGKAGMDASTFAHTFVTENEALIITPSPSMDRLADKIGDIQVRMDQILRKDNKEWFDDKGLFKKPEDNVLRSKGLFKSPEYLRLRWRVRMLWQRYYGTRKTEFHRVANRLVGKAMVFIMEDMKYRAMQKRGRHEVEVTRKQADGVEVTTTETQTFRRFGRSMQKAAPGMFFGILELKVLAAGGVFIRVNPADIKASQYNPITGECVKHGLDERAIVIADDLYVQRDLLAAYILMHVVKVIVVETMKESEVREKILEDEKTTDRKRLRLKAPRKTKKREKYTIDVEACRNGFPEFVRHSVCTILEALIEGREMPSSVGLDKFRELYENYLCLSEISA